jgi:hypothetical protein
VIGRGFKRDWHPSLSIIQSRLEYDPDTGIFKWIWPPSNCVRAGQIAGSLNSGGYRKINIDRISWLASNLAWFMVTGRWCAQGMVIDHKDTITWNDKFDNLQEITQSANKLRETPRFDRKVK